MCLRRTITFQEATAELRFAFVEAGRRELEKAGEKVNASRISMLSGVYREDVAKILRAEVGPVDPETGLIAAVVGQWERDPEFLTSNGTPRVLDFEGDGSSFHRLVGKVRKGVYPPTVLMALERATAVQRGPRGLKLIRGGTVADAESGAAFELLARDIASFIQSTEQNVARPDSIGEAYIRTEYDNISSRHLPQIRRWLVAHTKAFHKRARAYLARYDKDLNPRFDPRDPAGERVVLHAFSLSRPTPEAAPPSDAEPRRSEKE